MSTTLDTFEQLGAAPWAEHARTELAAGGARRRRRQASGLERLSPQELQIALLVAEGATNREIAAPLFVSPRTVQFHLGKVFRRLGLRSRTELARLLTERGTAASDDPDGPRSLASPS